LTAKVKIFYERFGEKMKSALEILFDNYIMSSETSNAARKADDKLFEYIYSFIPNVDMRDEVDELIRLYVIAESEAAFRAGFIAGAYPLTGEPIQRA
jgi:hypothetical protein